MKAFTVRCPDCGAQLKAEKGLKECTYCGTSIMVDNGGASEAEEPLTAERPVHDSRAEDEGGPSAALVLMGSLFLLGVTVLGLALSSKGTPADPQVATRERSVERFNPLDTSKTEEAPTMDFEAHHPVLKTVDSDEVADILGYFERDEDQFYAAALSGTDGSLLWRSDAIPGLIGGAEPSVIVGTKVVFAATGSGDLTAYSLRDGGTLWTIRLAEVVDEIYELDEGTAQILLTDKQVVHVGLERGGLMAPPEGAAELGTPLPSMGSREHRGATRLERWTGSRTFGDVDASFLAIADDGSFQVSIGPRREGTPTPVLIRYEGVVEFGSRGELKELWRTPVAGVEPMKARVPMGFGDFLHADAGFVCAAYHSVDKPGLSPTRLAAFDLEDGRRFWDQLIPGEAVLTSVTVIESRIYVVTWKGLTVLDAKSGDTLFFIDELPLD